MGRSLFLFVLFIAILSNLAAQQTPEVKPVVVLPQSKTTTIYLVRHAEKITDNPQDQDPGLTAAGLKRSADLKHYLQNVPIYAFFSTPYQRTQLTLTPLANGRPIQLYEAHDFTQFRKRLLNEYKGKTIVVAGHSNTVLPMIEAFGGKKPFGEIADNQYDNIVKITISAKGKTKVLAQKYGDPSTK